MENPMPDLTSHAALWTLAQEAVACMLERRAVTVHHAVGWARPRAWPLPIQRVRAGKNDTSETQDYRPFVILAYVDGALEQLANEAKAKASEATDPAKTFGNDYRADEPVSEDWSDLV